MLLDLDDIDPGEEIRINYGTNHPFKRDRNYQLLGYAKLQDYFKSHLWKGISASVQSYVNEEFTPGTSEYIEGLGNLERFNYILETRPRSLKD